MRKVHKIVCVKSCNSFSAPTVYKCKDFSQLITFQELFTSGFLEHVVTKLWWDFERWKNQFPIIIMYGQKKIHMELDSIDSFSLMCGQTLQETHF